MDYVERAIGANDPAPNNWQLTWAISIKLCLQSFLPLPLGLLSSRRVGYLMRKRTRNSFAARCPIPQTSEKTPVGCLPKMTGLLSASTALKGKGHWLSLARAFIYSEQVEPCHCFALCWHQLGTRPSRGHPGCSSLPQS